MGPHGGVKTLSLSREFGSYNCILDSRLVRMELIHIPAVAVSLGFAAVVQGAAGFGFILCATPLILLTGIPLLSSLSWWQLALLCRQRWALENLAKRYHGVCH